jgi:hypothetical protein
MSNITHEAMFGHVETQAKILIRRVGTWLTHPTYDTKTNLRQTLSEIEGMWRMAMVMAEYPATDTDTPQYDAIIMLDRARGYVRRLDYLQKNKHSLDIGSIV